MLRKNTIKRVLSIICAFMLVALSLMQNAYASSVSLTAYATTLEIGATTTVMVNGSDLTGKFNISSSNAGVISLNSSSIWVENNSVSVTAKANAAGTATITLIPSDVSNSTSGDDITGSVGTKTLTIKVNAPAAPPTNNNTNNGGSNTTTLSSNANLKKLVPNYEGLSPNFNASTTKYSLTVPASVNSLNLTLATESTSAKYAVSGNQNFKLGDNVVTITVTAANGTKKYYTITVTKAADPAKANASLSNIIIDGKTLNPAFAAETVEYDIGTVSADVDKLTVLAYSQSEDAKVDITGNEGLVEGENKINVKVTAADGVTTRSYVVKVTKEAKPAVVVQDEVRPYETNNYVDVDKFGGIKDFFRNIFAAIKANALVLLLYAFVLVEFAQILYLYKKVNGIQKGNTKDAKKDNDANVYEDVTINELNTNRRRSSTSIKTEGVVEVDSEDGKIEEPVINTEANEAPEEKSDNTAENSNEDIDAINKIIDDSEKE